MYLYLASQIFRIMYMKDEDIVPVRLVLIVIFMLIEYFRLSNGFYGNLKESVSVRLRSSLKSSASSS